MPSLSWTFALTLTWTFAEKKLACEIQQLLIRGSPFPVLGFGLGIVDRVARPNVQCGGLESSGQPSSNKFRNVDTLTRDMECRPPMSIGQRAGMAKIHQSNGIRALQLQFKPHTQHARCYVQVDHARVACEAVGSPLWVSPPYVECHS